MAPLSMAHKVDAALSRLGRIPLRGHAPRFDLANISQALSSRFGAPNCLISIGGATWRKGASIAEGLPNRISLGISMTPLAQEALWLMSRQDVSYLTSWLLHKKSANKIPPSEMIQEGFYRYLALAALDVLHSMEPLRVFTLQLDEKQEESSIHSEQAYCIDIQISLEGRSCWGRLVLGESLLNAWHHHFASLHETFSLSSLAKHLEVPVSVLTGSVLLTLQEWNRLEVGDVVLLDQGSYDPRRKEGVANLSLGMTPLFHISVKENKIKLLEPALVYEEEMETNRETRPKELSSEATSSMEEGKSMAVKELPLFVTVELARLRMTVEHLMNLSPGHFLELPLHPNKDVSLTVDGQKIGRGELVHLGEKLGVRILEIAEG